MIFNTTDMSPEEWDKYIDDKCQKVLPPIPAHTFYPRTTTIYFNGIKLNGKIFYGPKFQRHWIEDETTWDKEE